MVIFFRLLLLGLPLGVGPRARGASVLTPLQREILAGAARPLPAADFSFDRPPGPRFTAAEQAEQLRRGAQVLPLVRAAWSAGDRAVRIPPGHYRFPAAARTAGGAGFALEFAGLQRADHETLVIDGSLDAAGAPGEYWLTLEDPALLATLADPDWQRASRGCGANCRETPHDEKA